MADLPAPIAAFDDAQRRTIALVRDVVRHLEAGMSERDIFELAETRRDVYGFSTWYHKPEIKIGGGAVGWINLPSARRKLTVGDLLTLDMGPGEGTSYGDFGYTLRFGADEPPVVKLARECATGCCGYASRWKTVGEIFIFAASWVLNQRMTLVNRDSIGHRILQAEGALTMGFPASAHVATFLKRNRVHRLNPVRMDGMFAFRPEVRDRQGQSAAFEEIIYIHDDFRQVLGRARLEDVGTLAGD